VPTAVRRFVLVACVGLVSAAAAHAQVNQRRLTTVDALRQFPGYFHLQNVLVRGELTESGRRLLLRSDAHELGVQLAEGVSTLSGAVDVRGQLIDVGRLEPGDPRAGGSAEPREADRWPRPGEELFLRVTAVAAAPAPSPAVSVRGLALEPWRFAGQTVRVVGNFRGRNLFGDLPDGPSKSRYDFVIKSTDGAVWVTGVRPRGKGFDLDVDRRLDTNRWVEVTGVVVHDRGLVRIEGAHLNTTTAPNETRAAEEPPAPAAPAAPVQIVFFSPSDGETDVSPTSAVRVQFSKGLSESSFAGRIAAAYVGGAEGATPVDIAVRATYDAANRSIEIKFAEALQPFRSVTVRLLEGITAFDRGPLQPWSLTFSVGR
jgi:hypothetical protein